MKKLLSLGALATIFLGAASAQAARVTYLAEDMTGAKVHPPVVSTATASFEITIDTDTKTYCARTTVNPATLVTNGIIIFTGDDATDEGTLFQTISDDDASNIIWKSGALTDEQITALGADDHYVQLTTEAHQDGELRDQLLHLDDDNDPGITCPPNDGDAGADAGADAAVVDDAGTDSGAGDGDGSVLGPVDDASVGVTPKGDASTTTSGDGTADSTADSSCTTSAPGGAPAGMAFALVGGLGIVAAIRRRRRRV